MEIVVKINDGPSETSYKDGDIIQAFTLDEIYYHHAQIKCNVRNFGFETDGSRTPDPLLINFLERTKTYKFERINSNYIRRTNLITNEERIIGKTPNEHGQSIDPYRYITKQLKNDFVNPSIAALSKQSHSTLIDILQLKDEQSIYNQV